ncbi:MAG: hypothetical protein Q9170_000519 [Blastenia crenularia]
MAPELLNSDAVEYQGCYLWRPNIDDQERPAKRRKRTNAKDHLDSAPRISTVPLLRGKETQCSVHARLALFDVAWKCHEKLISHICNEATIDTVENVSDFICDHKLEGSVGSAIPSGLITVGPSSSIFANLVSSVSARLKLQRKVSVINVIPSQTSNLKSALKLINSRGTGFDVDAENDNQPEVYQVLSFDKRVVSTRTNREQRGRRPNYDLQILCDHVRIHGLESIILAFHDSEAFEAAFLTDLIDLISCWNDRIPFVCLFAVKTSIELFQEKLPQRTIRRLQGLEFDVAHTSVNGLFRAVSSRDETRLCWLGPGVSNLVLQAHETSIQSTASFTSSLKYAYMSHFFANPLSVLLRDALPSHTFQEELYDSIRNADSFRHLIEEELGRGNVEKAKNLLNRNDVLRETVIREIKRGKGALNCLVAAVDLLSSLHSWLRIKTSVSWSNLYIKAIAGDLRDSTIIQDALLAVRKLPSDAMADLLSLLVDSSLPSVSTHVDDLQQLESEKDGAEPLRSEHDTRHESLRTTVVAHKVELSKHKSSLSKLDLSYSRFVDRINKALQDYLHDNLINPQELFLHEVLIYDLKSPHREVFAPKPRYAIERALSSPRDYLGCDCCKGAQHGLSGTHPATSILYQLYLESGAIINVSDLRSAFYTIIGTEGAEDEDAEQEMAQYAFP